MRAGYEPLSVNEVWNPMDTKVKPVEVLPLVKYYMEQLGLARLFDKFVPNSKGAEIAPTQVLYLLVMK